MVSGKPLDTDQFWRPESARLREAVHTKFRNIWQYSVKSETDKPKRVEASWMASRAPSFAEDLSMSQPGICILQVSETPLRFRREIFRHDLCPLTFN
ncbi:hypothetical protein N7457_003131 [Penicillium paradoxum]|uniref:uncharacterized protein n=1 Tax=Penicillium paradoxum TaxID=176176 RepID=UPI0025469423|nr:uncharacterized protein N7457_003131 [Penicillium paradoxum]KAJ5788141.1 hypothetical protein N7457_003131 [Penicillium paradoxum]